jgi:hypothetical protein
MPEPLNETRDPDLAAAQAPDRRENSGTRTILLISGALVALLGTYLLAFLSMLMIGFSFDAPGSHFSDSGLWFRLLMLWPPASLFLVAIAAIICIFRESLRLLWIALGIFAATVLAIVVALSLLG